MRKTNWLAEAENQKREWNTMAKWSLKYRPNDEETVENYADIGQTVPSHRMPAEARAKEIKQLLKQRSGNGSAPLSPTKSAQEGEDMADESASSARRRIHIRHKHKRVCPDHTKKHLHANDHNDDDCGVQASNGNDSTKKKGTHAVAEITNRMIRQQPLTYLLNERAEELVELGLARPPPMLLPGLHIPRVAGAGTCRMLTGGMPVHNAKHFERRPNHDHPDFSKCTVPAVTAADTSALKRQSRPQAQLETSATLLSTKRGRHSTAAQDVGGFNISSKLRSANMEAAAENVRQNRPGALATTDQPSHDVVVLKQMHHAMLNRHRQFVYPAPGEAEARAKLGKQMVTSARDVDTSDSDLEDGAIAAAAAAAATSGGAHKSTGGAPAVVRPHRQHAKAHLPKSALADPSLQRVLSASRKERLNSEHTSRSSREQALKDHEAVVIAEASGARKKFLIAQQQKRHREAQQQQQGGGAAFAQQEQPIMLLRIPVDRTHVRQKNDIKRHHELAASLGGKVMMRGSRY